MMLSRERSKYVSIVLTLGKRFQSLDSEELKEFEFYQLMQDKQSVEELGVALGQLAGKAYPRVFPRMEQRSLTTY